MAGAIRRRADGNGRPRTLRPDMLRQIVHEAVAPFYESTLSRRTNDARRAWKREAQATLMSRSAASWLG